MHQHEHEHENENENENENDPEAIMWFILFLGCQPEPQDCIDDDGCGP